MGSIHEMYRKTEQNGASLHLMWVHFHLRNLIFTSEKTTRTNRCAFLCYV